MPFLVLVEAIGVIEPVELGGTDGEELSVFIHFRNYSNQRAGAAAKFKSAMIARSTVCFNPRQGKACHVMRKPNT